MSESEEFIEAAKELRRSLERLSSSFDGLVVEVERGGLVKRRMYCSEKDKSS